MLTTLVLSLVIASILIAAAAYLWYGEHQFTVEINPPTKEKKVYNKTVSHIESRRGSAARKSAQITKRS